MSEKKCVEVAVRVRPLVSNEISKGCKDVLEIYKHLNQIKIGETDKSFTYNYVFGPESSQLEIYEQTVRPMLQNLFNGYNLTVLAYGQTGSGKTHTMGTAYTGEGDMGVIPRTVNDIFSYVRDSFCYDFTITVSFMEIHNEIVYDLLVNNVSNNKDKKEECVRIIREDPTKGMVIPGLTEVPVENSQSVLETLMQGSKARTTGSTNMNAESSRSHAIFTVNLCMQKKADCSEKTAKFHFVDLAGSERVKKTGAVGTTFKEGVSINKGLLVLGNVISALGGEKQSQTHISYRESNLTKLLKDSLGGNSITLMIACVSPADYNIEETLSTLRYADRARKIQNKPIVNEDPKAAEINRLKKTIQDLKLQIVGQGGTVLSSDEFSTLREENLNLQTKIRDLTLQLSSTLNDNTGLLEKVMILQNANEVLHRKIDELKNDYNITLGNISLGFEQNDQETIKKNLAKLQEIQEQFVAIDSEQKKTENEIFQHEQNLDLHNSQNGNLHDETEMSADQEKFTNKQMALNNELQEVTKKLALKEQLARQIETNTQYFVDYKAMAENESKILSLQKEKEELLQQLKNAHSVSSYGPHSKLAEQRRKRVQELESQLQELNKKVQEQARMIKLKEKDVARINKLNSEIAQMKQMKVKLIKKMREEAESFKTWKLQRERELAKLKQQDRKKQNQIVKMEAMHSKQQNVLKRKVEEAVALNKRLKEALALRKVTQESKNAEKSERIGHWIKQEFEVHLHLVEAESTLAGLLEDRATLQEQLDELKKNPEPHLAQIKSIEEDIEMRSFQIQDLQQKLLDSDEESRKSKLDSIQTMGESKFALKTLMEQAVEIKKNEIAMKAKLIESQATQNEFKNEITKLEKIIKMMELKHAEDVSHVQKDYEEKIAVLLRQLRGVQVKSADEELRQRCAIQSEKIEELDKSNQDLLSKLFEAQQNIEEMKIKLDTIAEMGQNASKETIPDDVKTPVENRRNKKLKIRKEVDSTFIYEEQENQNISLEDTDDIEKDPDWTRTPIGKWILEKKRKLPQRSMLEGENIAKGLFKRTSDGGCTCLKSNCSSRCGCRKMKRACSSGCKCSSSNCMNRDETDLSESNSSVEKRPRLKEQNTLS